MAVLSAICSFAFVKSNIQQIQDKRTFESIYMDTTIDFIVPSPSDSQILEIEQNKKAWIKAVTPYYETASSIKINENNSKGIVIIVPDAEKIQYTPYGSSRIISGGIDIKAGDALADRAFASNNDCGIGDTVQLSILDRDYIFEIKSITENNTYYNDGTIAVVLSDEQAAQLQSDGIKYSAAYVFASDYEKCRTYLYNEYKPYGRLKDASDFDSEELYNQHVQNFEAADWTKEITNCKDNYSSLSVKYENVEAGIYRNMVIAAIIIFLTVIIFNSVLLRQENLKKSFQGFLIKKSGTKAEIKSFYRKGITFNVAVFCATTIVFYCLIVLEVGVKLVSGNAISSLAMIAAQIMASVIMIRLSAAYVEKNYTIKEEKSK